MTIEEIKLKISELALEHENTEPELEWVWEDLENETEDLIIDYCREKGYQVENFSYSEIDVDFLDRRFLHSALDRFILKYPDVAELMYHYYKSYWPYCYDRVDSFEHFMNSVRRS